jgi:hypothetical protein
MSVKKFGGLLCIYKWILVINSTLLMSFDVGKSRISEFLTMRDRTKEELAALCFSAIGLATPYNLSACHLSMLHHHGLTRTALCLSKYLVAKLHTMIMFIKPTRINLKGVCHSTLTQNVMYRYCAKEDDGLTEGAYCSCTAGYEIYACFFKFSIVSMQ